MKTNTEFKSILTFMASLIFFFNFLTCYAENNNHSDSKQLFNVGYKVLDFKYQQGTIEKILTVAVWYPTSDRPAPFTYGGPTEGNVAVEGKALSTGNKYPLLVFSHGYGGTGLSAVFLNEALASRGWIVVAPDHHDKYSAVRIRTGQVKDFNRLDFLKSAKDIANSSPEDREKYLYRLNEMKLALNGILNSEKFGNLIDENRIAVGGHSLGGFTALGVCGTIKEYHIPQVKALLLFSTGAGGYLFRESELTQVKIPLMLFIGEKEKKQKRGANSMYELAEKIFENSSPPKYFLEVKEASHFSFNNRFTNKLSTWFLSGNEKQFDVIRRYSIAFLETHIAGKKDFSQILEQNDPMLTRNVHK